MSTSEFDATSAGVLLTVRPLVNSNPPWSPPLSSNVVPLHSQPNPPLHLPGTHSQRRLCLRGGSYRCWMWTWMWASVGEFHAFVVFSLRWAYSVHSASSFRLEFAPYPPSPVLLPVIFASIPDDFTYTLSVPSSSIARERQPTYRLSRARWNSRTSCLSHRRYVSVSFPLRSSSPFPSFSHPSFGSPILSHPISFTPTHFSHPSPSCTLWPPYSRLFVDGTLGMRR